MPLLLFLLAFVPGLRAQTGGNVLLVVNRNDAVSRAVAVADAAGPLAAAFIHGSVPALWSQPLPL